MNHFIKASLFILGMVSLFSCAEAEVEEKEHVPTEGEIETNKLLKKDYWTPSEYLTILYYIAHSESVEDYPNFDNPDNVATIRKLLDTENFKVILEDEKLSLKERCDAGQEFFERSNKMIVLYEITKDDKFTYDEEFAEILYFSGLVWIAEIKTMNAYIAERTDIKSSEEIASAIQSNEKTCLRNFRTYLKYTRDEHKFGKAALKKYIQGINDHFPEAINTFPGADYELTSRVAFNMLIIAEDRDLKDAISRLIDLLEEKINSDGYRSATPFGLLDPCLSSDRG